MDSPWNTDLDEAPEETEVELACLVGDDQTRLFARLHWFDAKDNTRVQHWQSTWDGAPLPAHFTPYAWAIARDVPDPAAF